MPLNFVVPTSEAFERLSTGEVVEHHDSVRAFVIGSPDGSELFVSTRVPDLQFDHRVEMGHRPESKIDTDCVDEAPEECVIRISVHQTAFANGAIADQDKFEEVVVGQ